MQADRSHITGKAAGPIAASRSAPEVRLGEIDDLVAATAQDRF
jgi:hypothetical protein